MAFKEWLSGLLNRGAGRILKGPRHGGRETLLTHRAGPGNVSQGAGRAVSRRTEGPRVLAAKAAV